MELNDLRKEYTRHGLSEAEVAGDPLAQLQLWLDQAIAAGLLEPNAMTLATATPDGRPSARVVLLKGLDAGGLLFYTNYESRKGRELAANPWAALVFYWPELERQVRAEGRVTQLTAPESDAYFASRPTGAQLGAWASRQSTPIGGRDTLEQRVAELTAQYAGGPVPRPPFWGGYRLAPTSVEFWQGRPSRLHDRIRYAADAAGWRIERLSP